MYNFNLTFTLQGIYFLKSLTTKKSPATYNVSIIVHFSCLQILSIYYSYSNISHWSTNLLSLCQCMLPWTQKTQSIQIKFMSQRFCFFPGYQRYWYIWVTAQHLVNRPYCFPCYSVSSDLEFHSCFYFFYCGSVSEFLRTREQLKLKKLLSSSQNFFSSGTHSSNKYYRTPIYEQGSPVGSCWIPAPHPAFSLPPTPQKVLVHFSGTLGSLKWKSLKTVELV